MSRSEIDPNWIVDLARRAGEIAATFFGKTTGQLKADKSWVTEADLAVELYLRAAIEEKRPQDEIIGEEGEKEIDPSAEFVWALDPIDGTRVFNHGLPVWGVSTGALCNDGPVLGAFVAPALGDLYHTDGDQAYLNGEPLTIPEPVIDENALFLVSEDAYKNRVIDYPGKVLSLGSAAAHLCYVAKGSAVGAMDMAGVWDYAGGAAILRSQGIQCRHTSGDPVDFASLYDGRQVEIPTLIAPESCFEVLRRAVT